MRLVILQTGDTSPEIAARHGGYAQLFMDALAPTGATLSVVDAAAGAPLPARGAVDAAVITGSPASVTEPEPWVEALAAWTRQAMQDGLPVLGVCYGHQLIAWAQGGEVQVSDRGMELGTVPVTLTPEGAADPLLGPLAGEPPVFHAVHGDVVTRLPPGAVRLAENAHTPNQAFRLGDRTWGVQFHPEFTAPMMAELVELRAERLLRMARAAGLDPDAALAAARRSLAPTPAGPHLLQRFVAVARDRVGA
ncbi:MAG: glutamine amidotransferase [Deltaproteobacteria bacterium]|nr:glutamine amidotransferase [Deltaproteobacteria bacterium]